MTVLPPPRRPMDLDRRWKRRVYPADPAAIRRVRAELRADLDRISGTDEELVAAVVLCASEMFAHGMDPAAPGGEGAAVVRTLVLRHTPWLGRVLRLSMTDRGLADLAPRALAPGPAQDWREVALGQGLVLIDHFSARWGTRRAEAARTGRGGMIWAEFDLPPRSAPQLRSA